MRSALEGRSHGGLDPDGRPWKADSSERLSDGPSSGKLRSSVLAVQAGLRAQRSSDEAIDALSAAGWLFIKDDDEAAPRQKFEASDPKVRLVIAKLAADGLEASEAAAAEALSQMDGHVGQAVNRLKFSKLKSTSRLTSAGLPKEPPKEPTKVPPKPASKRELSKLHKSLSEGKMLTAAEMSRLEATTGGGAGGGSSPKPALRSLFSASERAMLETAGSAVEAQSSRRGDVVSKYPYLVLPFILFQIASWVLSGLQVANVLTGRWPWAASSSMTPIDIAFCQMMFWGTLHFGPLSDGRLSIVCRLAFLVEAASFVANTLTIWRPLTVDEANAGETTPFDADQVERMIVAYVHTGVWLFVWAIFSAWIGTTALQVGRRRLLARVGADELPAFSSRLLRAYAVVLAVQVANVGWATWRSWEAHASSVEAEVYTRKVDYVSTSVSMCLAQLYGLKVVIFDASGTTVAQAARGRGGWRLYAACFFVLVYVLLVVADSVLVAIAADSSDPLLLVPDLVQKYLLDNVPYVLAWFAAMANFGLSIHHFVPWRSVDATEEMLKRRRATVAPAPE